MKPEYKKRMLVRIVERGVLGQALRNLSILGDLRRRTFNLSPGRYFSSAGQAPYFTLVGDSVSEGKVPLTRSALVNFVSVVFLV